MKLREPTHRFEGFSHQLRATIRDIGELDA